MILGISTIYAARSVVQHVGKDPRVFFSLHGIIRRCLRAERSGVPARLPGGWPKVPPERTVNSVSGVLTALQASSSCSEGLGAGTKYILAG